MKKSVKIFAVTLMMCLAAGSAFAKPKKQKKADAGSERERLSFSVYGRDHMVSIPLPDYWTVDMNVAHQNNFNGFFYIAEKGINESPAYIFLNLYPKREDATFSDFVEYQTTSLAEFQKKYSVEKTGSETVQRTMNNWNIEVYDVKIKEGHGHYQKIAYMECENKYYVEIYIDCFDDTFADNDKYVNDFVECYRSIDYLNVSFNVAQ